MLENQNEKENKDQDEKEEIVEGVSSINNDDYETSKDMLGSDLDESFETEEKEVLIEEDEDNHSKTVQTKSEIESKQGEGFIARFTANLVDQLLLLVVALGVFMIGKYGLPLVGLQYQDKIYYPTIFLVIYGVLNLIYIPIVQSTKLKKTFGKVILNIN